MNGNNFTEEDKENVVKYLNLVAKNAQFTMDTQEIIEYFQLLSQMQKVILPKINSHILEIKRVVDAPESTEE